MGKRNRKRESKRKKEIAKRKVSKLTTMQSTFIDADVFIQATVNEKSSSFKFFKSFRGKTQKVVTSTQVIGEVVKFFYRIAREEKNNSEYNIEDSIEVFRWILDTINISIKNFSDKTYEYIERIHAADERAQFKDAINVAVAYEERCNKFCTFDKGITSKLLKSFNITRITPDD